MQISVLLEATVVLVLLPTDVAGVPKIVCGGERAQRGEGTLGGGTPATSPPPGPPPYSLPWEAPSPEAASVSAQRESPTLEAASKIQQHVLFTAGPAHALPTAALPRPRPPSPGLEGTLCSRLEVLSFLFGVGGCCSHNFIQCSFCHESISFFSFQTFLLSFRQAALWGWVARGPSPLWRSPTANIYLWLPTYL